MSKDIDIFWAQQKKNPMTYTPIIPFHLTPQKFLETLCMAKHLNFWQLSNHVARNQISKNPKKIVTINGETKKHYPRN